VHGWRSVATSRLILEFHFLQMGKAAAPVAIAPHSHAHTKMSTHRISTIRINLLYSKILSRGLSSSDKNKKKIKEVCARTLQLGTKGWAWEDKGVWLGAGCWYGATVVMCGLLRMGEIRRFWEEVDHDHNGKTGLKRPRCELPVPATRALLRRQRGPQLTGQVRRTEAV